jgi:hypothetical protein
MSKTLETCFGAMKVTRKRRVAHETGKVLLIDVLHFIERRATPVQLRSVQIALFGKHLGAVGLGSLAIANVERFILTADSRELKRIEAATAERRVAV